LASGAAALLSVAVFQAKQPSSDSEGHVPTAGHAFKLSQALLIAAMLSGVTLLTAVFRHFFGDSAALATAVLAGLVELHSAVVSVAQLATHESVQPATARWGVMAVLGASVVSKVGLAYLSGGQHYGTRVALGLLAFMAAVLATMGWGPTPSP
jgi:uncharacterized membrane protein (DUF4010 family)